MSAHLFRRNGIWCAVGPAGDDGPVGMGATPEAAYHSLDAGTSQHTVPRATADMLNKLQACGRFFPRSGQRWVA